VVKKAVACIVHSFLPFLPLHITAAMNNALWSHTCARFGQCRLYKALPLPARLRKTLAHLVRRRATRPGVKDRGHLEPRRLCTQAAYCRTSDDEAERLDSLEGR